MAVKARMLVSAMAIVAVAAGVSACSDNDDQSQRSSVSTAADQVSDDAAPASSSLSGAWQGNWQLAGAKHNAQLGVITEDPFLATIDIPGKCGATWREKSRDGAAIIVTTTVTYGQCADNNWKVSITHNTITAVDMSDPTSVANFTRH